jgi:hypothetical protein
MVGNRLGIGRVQKLVEGRVVIAAQLLGVKRSYKFDNLGRIWPAIDIIAEENPNRRLRATTGANLALDLFHQTFKPVEPSMNIADNKKGGVKSHFLSLKNIHFHDLITSLSK